jgi:6-phosphofructokinase 1
MSGGTTSVINSTLAGIIQAAQECPSIGRIYAGYPGLVGALEGEFIDLTSCSPHQINIIKHSPGSASIGTTRVKVLGDKEMCEIVEMFLNYDIKYFINIGGNGTIKQTKAIASFSEDVAVCAAPKTVDNDLGDREFEKLWYTPGFPSVANYWYHKTLMLDNENRGASTHDKVLVAQTFGRDTGFIVGSMRLANLDRKNPLVLLLPEDQRDPEEILSKIDQILSIHDRVVVGIAEGYKVGEYKLERDLSGQTMYGSSGSTAAQELVNLCMAHKIQSRSYIPTIDQRQNFEHTLESDINVAYELGQHIIRNFMKGKKDFFQTRARHGIDTIPLESIGNFTRRMKDEWVDSGNFDVTESYLSYLSSFMETTKRRIVYVGGSIR